MKYYQADDAGDREGWFPRPDLGSQQRNVS